MTICIVDTSILVELLNVPGCASRHAELVDAFAGRQQHAEQFLLPLAVLVETGNHVAHVPDGAQRRSAADRFVTLARDSLRGTSPFSATPLPSSADIAGWLDEFPDCAMRGIGLADRSLIALWGAQRELHPHRRVYLWTLDEHLVGYDTGLR